MQSDLISRSALIETLTKYKFGAISNNTEREYIKETVLNFVKEQPTAYDVEKVIDEVDDFEIRCCDCQESCNTEGCLIERIKNVIRNGGKE